MLLAALAFVVIASCYDGDTCTTTSGERVRLACINSPELHGKRAEPVPAKAARDHLRGLVMGKKIGIRRITKDRYGRTVAELFAGDTNVQREMDFLFRKVGHYRHCLYAGKPLEEYLEYSAASADRRCPKPAWV